MDKRDLAAAVMVAFAVGVGGLVIAHNLLWRRSLTLFWAAATLIGITLVWITATGLYRDVAAGIWPWPFDEIRGPEILRKTECAAPTLWATGLMVVPVLLVAAGFFQREKRVWVKALILLGGYIFYVLIAKSPLPDKVVRMIEPNVEQRLPAHCQQRAS